jgi:uncharacterized protein (TIGR03083 family)
MRFVSDLEMATAERSDLAEFLETLTADQWEAPSLCEGWRVRDVVAHLISLDGVGPLVVARRVIRGRVINTNQVGVDELASRSTDELLATLRSHLTPGGLAAGLGGMIPLMDATIHHQDIRRPLGLPREIPPDRLRRVLNGAFHSAALPARRVARGVRLVATDLAWSRGSGPEVSGTAEALLMTVAGRRGMTDELAGPGQPVLARRLPH